MAWGRATLLDCLALDPKDGSLVVAAMLIAPKSQLMSARSSRDN